VAVFRENMDLIRLL